MTTHTVLDAAPEDGETTEHPATPVRILNVTDPHGLGYRLPSVGCIDGPGGISLIGIRDQHVAFVLPPHIAVGWALALARYTLIKTQSAHRPLRDQLIDQAQLLIDELIELPVHESPEAMLQ